MMTRILTLLALLLLSMPARADEAYGVLFNGKEEWLNTARPVTADDAKGRAVLLDFWTYGCINCMQVVPDLKALEKQFGDNLLVIGVHSAKFAGERGSDRILAAAKRFGVTHPVVNDSQFKVWDAYKVEAWPTLILIGPDGNEVNRYAGEGHKDEIAADLSKLFDNKTAAAPIAGLKMTDADKSTLSFPSRLGFASDTPWGELIFIADAGHNRIVGADVHGNIRVTIGAGDEGAKDGDFTAATFNHPRGFGVAKDGLYIADTGNHMIRYADFKTKTVTRVAGTGERGQDRSAKDAPTLTTALASPWDAKMLPDNKTLVIAVAGLHQLWALDTEKKTLSVLAGTGEENIKDGPANEAALAQPSGISVLENTVYFVDAESSSLRELWKGQVKTLVGKGLFDFGIVDGKYQSALMQHAQGLDAQPGRIVVADTYNNALRLYNLDEQNIQTIPLPKDALAEPGDVMQLNGLIYVADTTRNRVVIVDANAWLKQTGEKTEKPATVTPFNIALPKK